jgi:aminoglycoside 3-N-acetyltransferase
MTLDPALQRALEGAQLAGANILVDAHFTSAADAAACTALLRSVVGPEGTIVMPAFTHARTLSDEAPEPIAFHSDLAVNADLGAVAETFRRHPGSLRSGHPTNSFIASGPRGHDILSTNRDNNPLGPVKKLSLMNGLALRLRQPLSRSTPIHLAEMQSLPGLRYRGTAKRINVAGFEERVVVEHVATCTSGFDTLTDIVAATAETDYQLACEDLHLVPLREVVRAVAAAVTASPQAIICGRDSCRTCAVRVSLLNRLR